MRMEVSIFTAIKEVVPASCAPTAKTSSPGERLQSDSKNRQTQHTQWRGSHQGQKGAEGQPLAILHVKCKWWEGRSANTTMCHFCHRERGR